MHDEGSKVTDAQRVGRLLLLVLSHRRNANYDRRRQAHRRSVRYVSRRVSNADRRAVLAFDLKHLYVCRQENDHGEG